MSQRTRNKRRPQGGQKVVIEDSRKGGSFFLRQETLFRLGFFSALSCGVDYTLGGPTTNYRKISRTRFDCPAERESDSIQG